ncbi:eCIS core domain-containing protein [Sorangium sp. So ce341]|uniref:eCIS core domain-containing protein n=1 Tax=Sorangium sp. So ce341 TaxID=3133302 RepID=UPI003F606209
MRCVVQRARTGQPSAAITSSAARVPEQRRQPQRSLQALQRAIGNRAIGQLLERGSALGVRSAPADTSLVIGAARDEHEVEADHVAERVLQARPPLEAAGSGLLPGRSSEPARPVSLQTKPVGDGAAQAVAPPVVRDVLRSTGQPLDAATRGFFEPRFGADFGGVRVHQGELAERAARSVDAQAFTVGHQIVLGRQRHAPGSRAGLQLMAHELTHVMQQAGGAGRPSASGRGVVQRTPAEAEATVGRHTSWGDLDEGALGRALLAQALGGDVAGVTEVFDALSSTDRDDVAYELTRAATGPQLERLAASAASRQLLHRVFDELTSGSVSAEEQQEADRIVQVTARQTVDAAAFDAAATSRRTKIFPFRLPGFTVFHDAPIEARRVPGGVWVHSYVRVLGTSEFRAETRTLPTEYFLGGIVLPETEVIGVRLYDQGGIIHYTTPLFLIQLANATDQRVLEKILEAAGIGLTLGTGALAGLGVEASMTARVLLWADRAAFALGTVTSVLREHRSWLVAQFGPEFMDAVDVVHSATAIYGLARVALQAPRIVQGLRDGYRAFRDAARARASGLSSSEQATVAEVTRGTDDLIAQIDNIQGARPAARTGGTGPEVAPPAPGARPAEPTPAAGRAAQPPGPAPEAPGPARPAAPAAAARGGSYRPTQAELEGYADRAWQALGGTGPRPAVNQTPLPAGTLGQYRSRPSTIDVRAGAASPGEVIDTVWHEASHARIRQFIGFMNEHLGHSWQRTLLRPLDEIVSYFIGGLGRVIQGPTIASRLAGILGMLGAPITALGSMATAAEIALWVPHAAAYAAAVGWAIYRIGLAIRDSRDSESGRAPGTPQPAPAP